jgi:ubiquinone/menaquinone biosynthesis C-methylase UbiE
MVGCGSSSKLSTELSSEMETAGYFVTNIDISAVVLEQMAVLTHQDYLVVDATRMPFKAQSFDIALDKGTFDALAVRLT